MKDRVSSLNKKGVKAVVFRPEISDTETKDASSCLQVGALSSEFWIQIADLKQLLGLKNTKMVMYSITLKLNSTFRTTGNATADKMTAKVEGKNSSFRFSVNN